MHAILGATGHVGSSLLSHLIESGEDVLAITHSPEKKSQLEESGAEVAIVDVKDSQKLAEALRKADSVFVLNPPGDVSQDSFQEEEDTIHSIVDSIKLARPKRLVVESTQGAQKGTMIGDLGVLFELEEELRKLNIPTTVTRAGFYMSNWDVQLESAKQGKIQSLFPADFKMPMAAPQDLGEFNAYKLSDGESPTFEIYDFFGPELYSARDVANAFAKALNRPVEVEVVPQEKWEESFISLGFSPSSAKSYAQMSRIAFEHDYQNEGRAIRGKTSLDDYIRQLCQA